MNKKAVKRALFLLSALVLAAALVGCEERTTVILPPDTGGTVPSTSETPVSEPATEASSDPVTQPTVTESTEPVTQPSTEPSSEPTEPEPQPSAPPTSAPTTAPTTEPPGEDVYDISGHRTSRMEREILAELNARRSGQNLPELSTNSTLSALAHIRAYESTQSFAHSRPDGRSYTSVLSDYGYGGWTAAGENLLYCSQGYTAAQLVDAWMASDTHRGNILSPDFTTVGIGVYEQNGLMYIAGLFAG